MKVRFLLITGYLGAVIGAGFASGQEIVQFFVSYGPEGFKGVVCATLLFALCGGLLLFLAHEHKISQYQGIIEVLLGKSAGPAVDILMAIFLFIGISTMLSASGAVFYEHLFLPKNLGILLAYALILLVLFSGQRGLFLSFYFLVPIKIVLLLIITGLLFFTDPTVIDTSFAAYLAPHPHYWPISSLLYVAYNFALAMVVLTEYQAISRKRDAVVGAVWGGIILGILVMLSYLALIKFMPMVLHYQVPMLYVAGNLSVSAKYIYTAVLWIGILTTAIANAFGVSQRLASFSHLKFRFCLFVVTTLALPLSLQSFSVLVSRVYPIFGVLGVVIVAALLYKVGKDISQQLYYNMVSVIKGLRR